MNELLDLTRREISPVGNYYSEELGRVVQIEDDAAKLMFSRVADLHTEVLRRQDAVKRDFIIIGAILAEIERDELYHCVSATPPYGWGYSNFYKFCAAVFGYKKRTVANLLAVYRKFCDDQGLIKVQYSNFSYSQLVELSRIEEGYHARISVKCSSKDIRRLKEYYKDNKPKEGTTYEDDLAEWKVQHRAKLDALNAEKNAIQFMPAFHSEQSDKVQPAAPQDDDQEIVTPIVKKKVRTTDVIKGLLAQLELLKQSDQGARWCVFAGDVIRFLRNDVASGIVSTETVREMEKRCFAAEEEVNVLSRDNDNLSRDNDELMAQVNVLEEECERCMGQREVLKRDYATLLKEYNHAQLAISGKMHITYDGYTPEKLDLKNKKAREEWLKGYESWGVWFEVPDLDLKYYRCNFVNGSAVVVTIGSTYEWDYSKNCVRKRPSELVKYSIIDDEREVYDILGVSFTQTVEWLTKHGKEI